MLKFSVIYADEEHVYGAGALLGQAESRNRLETTVYRMQVLLSLSLPISLSLPPPLPLSLSPSPSLPRSLPRALSLSHTLPFSPSPSSPLSPPFNPSPSRFYLSLVYLSLLHTSRAHAHANTTSKHACTHTTPVLPGQQQALLPIRVNHPSSRSLDRLQSESTYPSQPPEFRPGAHPHPGRDLLNRRLSLTAVADSDQGRP